MSARGVLGGVLGLIVLQVIVSRGGSRNVSGLFGTVAATAKRALDPKVPAIPDLRKGAKKPASATGGAVIVPASSSQAAQFGLI